MSEDPKAKAAYNKLVKNTAKWMWAAKAAADAKKQTPPPKK
jgi:hypothetical protein